MVMGLLCVSSVFHYMYNDRICAIYLTRNIFGKIVLSNIGFRDFSQFCGKNRDNFAAPTFELNGHGTSVCYFCIVLHV